MSHRDSPSQPASGHRRSELILPQVPALVAGAGQATLVSTEGEIDEIDPRQALDRLTREPFLVVHAEFTARRLALGRRDVPRPGPQLFDLLDLFGFVHPARDCLPTPVGLLRLLGLISETDDPVSADDLAALLPNAAERLLKTLMHPALPGRTRAAAIAERMTEGGWPWGPQNPEN